MIAVAASVTLGGCGGSETGDIRDVEPEVVEVREWDPGCFPNPANRRGPFLPDTVAYPPGRISELRIVSLGGCVDSLFYREEQRIYAALDSLGVPDSVAAWPFDSRLELAVQDLGPNERPEPVADAVKVILDEPETTFYAVYGFSRDFGILWAEVHQGPHFRLNRVMRSTGGTVSFVWESPLWPLGGPGSPDTDVPADTSTRQAPPPPQRWDGRQWVRVPEGSWVVAESFSAVRAE